ncbi:MULTISPECIES: outer membrane lipoprotein chaperone LolA [unclassified Gilliamella]|uniref:outer membrane lipoprotein chaperone LolA n=1 Tax=unclassified Gilliamella TaxID=2685620 RepID=UPI00080DCD72|nr:MULTISPECIES: outer membrane lipoprotein chaperone LolA [Gilliamella]MCX8574028.1 outer membrane lipoprotein chaperone LolA [Gilliamella sp. B3831]MCX8576259.1 outer membrane lipoprotein chaperone LolA [Gilliamella sp. B3815]MCX8603360.1 outer membrane lipoprotein chaperone LolA [Gilliamella sp. B3823]MCX8607023.1 outer membrane lipoprotein chaperone LolA [Gilliamella sp. B3825]MCX8636541.1 outer membrane lipoprotein chaperone LolA [Gilliamella sp. B3817]
MKQFLVLMGLLVSVSAWAGDKEVLQQRLDKVDGFYARFSQDVKTADNQQVQEGKGDLWVTRPYYFNWKMTEPEETTIISDGSNMWVYTPTVEQVTVMDLKKAVDNRLMLLITDSHNPIWNHYQVTRKQDSFTLKPTDSSSQNFIISVLPSGMISNFTIIEEDGQRSFYDLSHQKLGKVELSKFHFEPPLGIQIDDQR